MSALAAVMVTHNSEDHLGETLASITSQTRPAEYLLAVDDRSSDSTVEMLVSAGFTVFTATSQSLDPFTRIAQNFHQGVRAAKKAGATCVVLGDHDDLWHQNRLEHQADVMKGNPDAAVVASDAFLVDEWGVALPGTLRGTFPVPDDFTDWSQRRQWAYGVRHSLATGGACALRIDAFSDWSVPVGWLHDRWWSLRALRHGALVIDSTPVIDYRISADQQVGLDTADQDRGLRWWSGKAKTGISSAMRARDLARLVRG